MKMHAIKAVLAAMLLSPVLASAEDGTSSATQPGQSAAPTPTLTPTSAAPAQPPAAPRDGQAGTSPSADSPVGSHWTPVAPAAPSGDAGKDQPTPSVPNDSVKVPVPGAPAETGDLRDLIGVNPAGLRKIEMPHLPSMSLRGFIKPADQEPMAILEITELNRTFLVQEGTEIPVMVSGRVTPLAQAELTGLGKAPATPTTPANSTEQSQIILKVKKVTTEGVIVETGVMAQTIVIR